MFDPDETSDPNGFDSDYENRPVPTPMNSELRDEQIERLEKVLSDLRKMEQSLQIIRDDWPRSSELITHTQECLREISHGHYTCLTLMDELRTESVD